MPIDRRLLAILGRRIPAIYDVIPRGALGQLARVALNPQPLPPHELGAAVAAEFVHTAWLGERFGGDPGLALRDLEDWCPTRPKPPKLPLWWPPIPIPDPRPDWFVDFHLGFAARLAGAAAGLEGGRLVELFDKAIERSVATIETATGEQAGRRS